MPGNQCKQKQVSRGGQSTRATKERPVRGWLTSGRTEKNKNKK